MKRFLSIFLILSIMVFPFTASAATSYDAYNIIVIAGDLGYEENLLMTEVLIQEFGRDGAEVSVLSANGDMVTMVAQMDDSIAQGYDAIVL